LTSATNQEKIKIMTLQDAINHFRKLESESTKKSEIRVYQNFIQLLSSLENRNLSDAEVQGIEHELESLDLNLPLANTKKYYNTALSQFQKYLKDAFSLTTKGYYTKMGVGLGATFGVLFGIIVLSSFERSLGISFGISIGMVIGLIIGRNLDSQAMASGRVV